MPTLFKEVELSPTLLEIEKQYGKETLQSYIALWIVRLMTYGGMECNVSEDLMLDMFYDCFNDYKHIITLADLKLFSDYAIKGRFTENNNAGMFLKLNARVLSDWIIKYINMRLNAAETSSMDDACQYKYNDVRSSEIKSMKDMDYKFINKR